MSIMLMMVSLRHFSRVAVGYRSEHVLTSRVKPHRRGRHVGRRHSVGMRSEDSSASNSPHLLLRMWAAEEGFVYSFFVHSSYMKPE